MAFSTIKKTMVTKAQHWGQHFFDKEDHRFAIRLSDDLARAHNHKKARTKSWLA
jgi:hypothetical protein